MLKVADWAFMAVGALESTDFTASKPQRQQKGCCKYSDFITMYHG